MGTSSGVLGYLFSSQGEFQPSAFPPLGMSVLVLTFSLLTSIAKEGKQWGDEFRQAGDISKR